MCITLTVTYRSSHTSSATHLAEVCIGVLRPLPLGAVDRGCFNFLKQCTLNDVPMAHHLERIMDKDSAPNRPPTASQQKRKKIVGNAATLNCFVCRHYLKPDETTEYNTT
eukprot:11358740-Ditylum_brightwellii.AAC.1